MHNTSDQLHIFSVQELNDLTLSHSDRLAKILALLENEPGWKAIRVPLLSMHFPQLLTTDQIFLSGRMLKGLYPPMEDAILSQFYKPLPTLGFMSANGNCLIHRGYYPKIIRSSSFEHNTHVFLSEPKAKHGGDNIPYVNNIRRLTEIECERLQGFPDNWTQYGNYEGIVTQIPKTQRYKMIGNAVTATIVEMVGKRIQKNTL